MQTSDRVPRMKLVLTLVPGQADRDSGSTEYQKQLDEFEKSLNSCGLDVSTSRETAFAQLHQEGKRKWKGGDSFHVEYELIISPVVAVDFVIRIVQTLGSVGLGGIFG